MHITTNVVRSYLDEVYSILYYVIEFVSDLQQVTWFSPLSSTNKTDLHDITEILLKVTFLSIALPPTYPVERVCLNGTSSDCVLCIRDVLHLTNVSLTIKM